MNIRKNVFICITGMIVTRVAVYITKDSAYLLIMFLTGFIAGDSKKIKQEV